MRSAASTARRIGVLGLVHVDDHAGLDAARPLMADAEDAARGGCGRAACPTARPGSAWRSGRRLWRSPTSSTQRIALLRDEIGFMRGRLTARSCVRSLAVGSGRLARGGGFFGQADVKLAGNAEVERNDILLEDAVLLFEPRQLGDAAFGSASGSMTSTPEAISASSAAAKPGCRRGFAAQVAGGGEQAHKFGDAQIGALADHERQDGEFVVVGGRRSARRRRRRSTPRRPAATGHKGWRSTMSITRRPGKSLRTVDVFDQRHGEKLAPDLVRVEEGQRLRGR